MKFTPEEEAEMKKFRPEAKKLIKKYKHLTELKMTADPGPEIEGYVDDAFEDAQPSGEEIEVRDSELDADLQ